MQFVHSHVGVVWADAGAGMQSLFEMWNQQEDEADLTMGVT